MLKTKKVSKKSVESRAKVQTYTSFGTSLSTVVSDQTMDKVLLNIKNPPLGTASLDNLLQQISRG